MISKEGAKVLNLFESGKVVFLRVHLKMKKNHIVSKKINPKSKQNQKNIVKGK